MSCAFLSMLEAGSLNLSWSDNSANEDGFEIERCEYEGEFSVLASVGADESSFVDDSVVPGVAYQYRVRAYNAFGYSGYTNVAQGSVAGGNTVPRFGTVEDVVALSGEAAEVTLTVTDAETAIENLAFEVISSNLSVLPLSGIETEVQNGKLVVRFATSGVIGTSNLSVLASDGDLIGQANFGFELRENLPPTISSTSTLALYNSQEVGPISITVNDPESDAAFLEVNAVSLNEELVSNDSIRIESFGSLRKIYFTTLEVVSGSSSIRLSVNDGVSETYGAIPFKISYLRNEAPTISGLQSNYTLANGASLSAMFFDIADAESDASELEVKVTSSNTALVSPGNVSTAGTGSRRQLYINPTVLYSGVTRITVSVSDGLKTTNKSFDITVLPPTAIVEIVDFKIVDGHAVVEVGNRYLAAFTLWRMSTHDGDWERVSDAKYSVGAETTVITDPLPISDSVIYRVVASQ